MKVFDKLYINGEWIASHSTEMLEVTNPATEELAGRVPNGDVEDVEHAVAAATAAFVTWSQASSEERAQFIKAISDGLFARMQEIGDVISMEQGMPKHLAVPVQVGSPAKVMKTYVERAKLMDEEKMVGHSLVVKEPVGVCAFINPWNYPLHQIIGKVAPALAAGCTMVVKPSSDTPLNAFMLAEIIDEVGLPAGVFNLVTGPGRVVGERMCTHPDVDMISITGSTEAGIRVQELGAQTIKRVTQELGGKSANIILPDADLRRAVTHGVQGVMLNSGQTCIALTRMLVHESQYEQAVEIAKQVAESLVVGNPQEQTSFMGPMCSAAQKETVQAYIRKGIEEGARLVTGGEGIPEGLEKGFYVKPTIFADVTNDMAIAQEEIFGPVLCVLAYKDEAQAIEIANDSPFGLSGSVWAGDQGEAISVARKIRTGQVAINGGGFNYTAPFGGYKQSGNGREMGDEGLAEFVEYKAFNIS